MQSVKRAGEREGKEKRGRKRVNTCKVPEGQQGKRARVGGDGEVPELMCPSKVHSTCNEGFRGGGWGQKGVETGEGGKEEKQGIKEGGIGGITGSQLM